MKALFLYLAVVALFVIITIGVFTLKVNRPGLTLSTLVPGHNAFDYFQQAAALEVNKSEVDDLAQSQPTRAYTLLEKEALVGQNAAALAKVREGLKFAYMNPKVESADQRFPYYAQFRGLARLLHLEAEVEAAKHDYGGAANSDLDAIQMGEDIPHGSVLIGMLVGIACQSIGRKPLWDTMAHLNASQAKACAQRMELIQADHYPLADTWQLEKEAGDRFFGKMASDPTYPQSVVNAIGGNAQGPEAEWLKTQAGAVSAKDFMAGYATMMDKLIAAASGPYSHGSVPQPGSFYLEKLLLPVMNKAAMKERIDDETQNNLLTTMLAIHAYKAEHGKLPSTLNDLVPGYLSKIPEDPLTDHAPLRYKLSGSHFVLYSIGPDGIDNGGTPIRNTKDSEGQTINGPQVYYVSDSSQGDIVAGVNIL